MNIALIHVVNKLLSSPTGKLPVADDMADEDDDVEAEDVPIVYGVRTHRNLKNLL